MPVQVAKSWSSTLKLPKSTFPPRTSIADQAKYLKRCTDDLYKWQAQKRSSLTPFILHDGPPYANGSLHIGHALNKILKDLICRAEFQQGRRIQFVPGWDCHGLPIEMKALLQYKPKAEDRDKNLDAIGIRRVARALATRTVEEQKKGFRAWAVMADWENAWTTMDTKFEVEQLRVFQEMVRQGLIFRRYKPVYWSPSSLTALAEAELEYKEDHESTAAYIKFPLASVPQHLEKLGVDIKKLGALIWTTTPWTLPANRAIAAHPDMEYAVIDTGRDQLMVATSRLSQVIKACSVEDYTIIAESIKGSDLQGSTYINELRGQQSPSQPIILADFVSAESGSGLVHCAPGHGMEDYDVCQRAGIPAFAPVDDAGNFTEDALPDNPGLLAGISVLGDGSAKVLDLLGTKVLGVQKYKHKYPYDWRTKLPVIVRATEQWFAEVGNIKDDALAHLQDVRFIPDGGRARIESFVKGRSEWCISRQRAWGVPIPALYDDSGKAVLTEASVSHIISVIKERGIDAWWTDAENEPLWVAPGLTGSFTRGRDTMDVWFDSGSSWTQTEGQADVYSEGTDQHRGWFQSSLLTHTSASGLHVAPFKTLITHGFTLDQDGRKMSKSIGNVIAPSQIMDGSLLPPVKRKGQSGNTPTFDGLGPDALRLWVASSDYTRDVVIGEPVLKSVHLTLLKYRTTLKMLLGSMHSNASSLPLTKLDEIALYQLQIAMLGVQDAWRAYDFHKAVSIITRWVSVDLSSFYLDSIKDRLYCGDGGSVLHQIFTGFLQMLAPITPMLVEEAWDHRPEWMKDSSPHLYPFHTPYSPFESASHPSCTFPLASTVPTFLPLLFSASTAIKSGLEAARTEKLIGSSLQASVSIILPPASATANTVFTEYAKDLPDIFVVSQVEVVSGEAVHESGASQSWAFEREFELSGEGTAKVIVRPALHAKCPRCWRYVAPVEEELCGRCEDVVKDLGQGP